jgi:hypothetical protein
MNAISEAIAGLLRVCTPHYKSGVDGFASLPGRCCLGMAQLVETALHTILYAEIKDG